MQEVTVTRSFALDRDTALKEATTATMKAVETALGGTLEQTSDGSFSGTGCAFPQQRRNAFDRKTGAEVGYNIQAIGKLKDHGNGEFS